jgi:zinc transporter
MSDPEPTFVHSYLLDRRGGGQPIDEQRVATWQPDDGLLWVHLDVLNRAAHEWITTRTGLDPLIAEALLAGETRPRSIPEQGGLLIILRGVNMNPGSDPEDMVSVRVWIDGNRIITTRRRRVFSIQDVRATVDEGRGPKTSGEFLCMLVERLAERIGTLVDAIEEQIEGIETRVASANSRNLQGEIAVLRRETAALRRYLAPQRDALTRVRGRTETLTQGETYELEEQNDLITRYLEDLDLARERALVAQEELMNRLAQDQNSRLYVLSIVAAVFLPLSFVTGLLGMNVGGLPGTESPSAFLISVAIMVALGFGLLAYFRWRRWI